MPLLIILVLIVGGILVLIKEAVAKVSNHVTGTAVCVGLLVGSIFLIVIVIFFYAPNAPAPNAQDFVKLMLTLPLPMSLIIIWMSRSNFKKSLELDIRQERLKTRIVWNTLKEKFLFESRMSCAGVFVEYSNTTLTTLRWKDEEEMFTGQRSLIQNGCKRFVTPAGQDIYTCSDSNCKLDDPKHQYGWPLIPWPTSGKVDDQHSHHTMF
jgi:hypothetical protein